MSRRLGRNLSITSKYVTFLHVSKRIWKDWRNYHVPFVLRENEIQFRITKLGLPGVQIWYENFFSKEPTSNSDKTCSIVRYTFSPSFWQFVNTTLLNVFLFYCERLFEPFFHIFVRTDALLSKWVTHRCKQVVIGSSQVRWVSSITGNFPAKCFQNANRFGRTWWSIIIQKNDFVLPLSVFWPFFEQRTVQIGQLLIVKLGINRFPMF